MRQLRELLGKIASELGDILVEHLFSFDIGLLGLGCLFALSILKGISRTHRLERVSDNDLRLTSLHFLGCAPLCAICIVGYLLVRIFDPSAEVYVNAPDAQDGSAFGKISMTLRNETIPLTSDALAQEFRDKESIQVRVTGLKLMGVTLNQNKELGKKE